MSGGAKRNDLDSVHDGHEIHLYRPAWVIEAVRQVVQTSWIQTSH